jgi:hypothetical protein
MQYKIKERSYNRQKDEKNNAITFIPKMFDRCAINPQNDTYYNYSPFYKPPKAKNL